MMPAPRLATSLLVCILFLIPVQGTTIMVHNGESIQEAITASTDGDLIIVETGTYPEPIVINRSITLSGDGLPVIDARLLLNRDTVTVTAPGVILRGFTVVNGSRTGINVSARNSQIISCEITRHTHSGIAIRSVNGTTIRDIIINDISSGSPGYGIYLSQAGDTVIENVSLETTNGAGIYLYRTTNVTITNATITGALSHGVFIRLSDSITLASSMITGNGNGAATYGVLVENSPATYLTANNITDNRCNGIRLYFADGTTMSENIIDGSGVRSVCTGSGVMIESTSSAVLTRNAISDHTTGMQIISSSGTAVFQNTFSSLTQPVTFLASSATWQSPSPVIYTYLGSAFTHLTGNSWEGYNGIDPDKDGIGDIAYTVIGSWQDLAPLVEHGSAYTFPDSNHLITGCMLAGSTYCMAEAGVPLEFIPILIDIDGVTSLPGQSPELTVELGYGEENTPPVQWTSWYPAAYFADNSSRDEFQSSPIITSPTTYHFAVRANRSAGPYYYCGFDDIQSGWLTTGLGTLIVADTTPPPCITNLTDAGINPTSLSWSWVNPQSADLDQLSVFLNRTLLTNLSALTTTYTADDLAPNSCYEFSVECADAEGNRNLTRVNTTSCTQSAPDILPPGSVTNLRCTDIRPTSLTWEWDDPSDADFSNVLVYLDGVFTTHIPAGTGMFVATGLPAGTRHTLATLTIDADGNLNTTFVNSTAVTDQRNEDHSPSRSSSSYIRPLSDPLSPTATPTAIDKLPQQPPITPPATSTLPTIGDPVSPQPTVASLSFLTSILSLATAILVMMRFRGERWR